MKAPPQYLTPGYPLRWISPLGKITLVIEEVVVLICRRSVNLHLEEFERSVVASLSKSVLHPKN